MTQTGPQGPVHETVNQSPDYAPYQPPQYEPAQHIGLDAPPPYTDNLEGPTREAVERQNSYYTNTSIARLTLLVVRVVFVFIFLTVAYTVLSHILPHHLTFGFPRPSYPSPPSLSPPQLPPPQMTLQPIPPPKIPLPRPSLPHLPQRPPPPHLFPPVHAEDRIHIHHSPVHPITGHYDLYDTLDLSTVLGDINITVTPQPGSKPAILRLRSTSGTITVQLAESFVSHARSLLPLPLPTDGQVSLTRESDRTLRNVLSRQFHTEIVSVAGDVAAQYLLGNGGLTHVSSNAGMLGLQFLAVGVGPDAPVSRLETLTQPGAQNVIVENLVRFGAGPVVGVQARHTVQGLGPLEVRYPESWEGAVEATVQGVGQLDIEGDRVVIDRQDGAWHVVAHRGRGGARVELVMQGSGNLKFSC